MSCTRDVAQRGTASRKLSRCLQDGIRNTGVNIAGRNRNAPECSRASVTLISPCVRYAIAPTTPVFQWNGHYPVWNKLQTLTVVIIIVKISHLLPFPKRRDDNDDDDDDALVFLPKEKTALSFFFLSSFLSFFLSLTQRRWGRKHPWTKRKKRRKILTRKMARISSNRLPRPRSSYHAV